MTPAAAGAAPRCVNHPDRVATAACDGCRSALCPSCTFSFQGRQVCQACNQILRSGGTIAAAAAAPAPAPAPPMPQPALREPDLPQPTLGPPVIVLGLTPQRVLAGAGLGLFFGIIGAAIWAAVVAGTQTQFGIVAMLIGWAVGLGVLIGCQEGGNVPAAMGGVLALVAMMLGFLLTSWPPRGLDWLFIGIGVLGGIRMPLRFG